MEKEIFLSLSKEFEAHGFHLYQVGGTTRDFLLHREIKDVDLCSDATPEEMLTFLKGAIPTFARFGSLRLPLEKGHVDITSFRKEEDYIDHRHPQKITFIRDLNQDAQRRDFTINAIYMDAEGNLYDPTNGREDLKAHLIRTIGDPFIRFEEDPLRIIRAIRFSLLLSFQIEEHTAQAMKDKKELLRYINPQKIKEEIRKMKEISPSQMEAQFTYYGMEKIIKSLINESEL